MSEVLYRKYRPQDFSEVINQNAVKTILKNALQTERVSHAYLFHGPRGVGKTTLARILAKAVNCEDPKQGEPDKTCPNCKAIQSGSFLDLVEIDAASYTGVDNIREVIEHIKFTPSKGWYKVFIIDEVHMLSKAAFNALLKTLEEPPEHAIFILATTEIHKVPATIISRTQRFDFKAVPIKYILELFARVLPEQKVKIPEEAQRLIAQSAGGSFRDALSILDQLLSFGGETINLETVEEMLGLSRLSTHQKLLQMMIENDTKSAGQLVKDLAFEGKDMTQFAVGFLEYLRLVLLLKMGIKNEEALGLLPEETESLKRQADSLSAQRLLLFIKTVMEAYRESKRSPVAELPLLSAVMELTAGGDSGVEIRKSGNSEKAEAKQTARQETPQFDNQSGIDLGTVVDRWSEVLARVKEYNHSLISSLRLGRLVKMDGQKLFVAFPYSFHKETIETRKNKVVVEQVLEDVFGQRLKVHALLENEVREEDPEGNAKDSDLVNEALKVLGESQ